MTCPPPILSGSHHLSQVLEGSGGHRSRGRDDRMKDRTVVLKRSQKVFISGCPLLCPAPPHPLQPGLLALSLTPIALSQAPPIPFYCPEICTSELPGALLIVTEQRTGGFSFVCARACAQEWRPKGTGDIPQKPYALFFEIGVFYWPGPAHCHLLSSDILRLCHSMWLWDSGLCSKHFTYRTI